VTGEQHTPPGPDRASAAPIIERKIKPDGTVREYPCRLLHVDPGFVIIRFVMARGGSLPGLPVEVPPGSVSDGYFWKRRPYNLYRMRRADGSIIAHRFDALTDVALSPDVVSYRDLAIDWWVLPDGTIVEEDRDELEQFVASGAISAGDHRQAIRAAREVLGRYRHIIDEAEALERRLTPGV